MSYNDYVNYSLDPTGRPRFYGVYRGVVTNNIDPSGENKLSIMVPQVIGNQTFDNVPACIPPTSTFIQPQIGSQIWVMFEAGDSEYPVWLGTSTQPTGISIGYYGSFLSNTTQTSTTGATAITFDTTVASSNVTLSSGSRINFTTAGTYNIQFAGQIHQTSNGNPAINIWMKKNGVDIPDTTWQYDLSNQMHFSVPAFNYIANFAAGDYIEFYWTSTSTVYLNAFPAGTAPVYPTTPAVVVNVQQV